ncbi:MAG: hypothetical protein NVSMB57_08210 [Actinomycetota bacterium]
MRLVLAILFGVGIFAVGFGSIRSLVRPSGPSDEEIAAEEALAQGPAARVLYWCENCGAEILLVQRGNGHGFRHCGDQMHKREEIAREFN